MVVLVVVLVGEASSGRTIEAVDIRSDVEHADSKSAVATAAPSRRIVPPCPPIGPRYLVCFGEVRKTPAPHRQQPSLSFIGDRG